MTYSQSYRRILHKMGYYDYQQGLIFRHLKQDAGWLSHEKHCRDFILKAADLLHPKKITVLGSGWLLELPLAELTEQADKIVLVDIVHPPEVIAQTSNVKNIELSCQDISGGLIEEVWKKAGRSTFFNRLKSLDEIVIPEYHPYEDPGMVISLNILTQLETLPEKLLRRKTKATEEEYCRFREIIQNNHIGFLQKHNSVLITDVSEVFTDSKGAVAEQKTAVTIIPEGRMKEEWIWNFDLLHSDFVRKRSVFKVDAVIL